MDFQPWLNEFLLILPQIFTDKTRITPYFKAKNNKIRANPR